MPGERDYAYLAGLFDGEGTVEARYNTNRKHRAPDWTARIMIYNTDGDLMSWLQETFGGTVVTSAKTVRPLARRDLYTWRLSAKKGQEILIEMLPHLRVKFDQVEMLLQLVNLMGKPGCQRVPEDVMEQRLLLVDSIREAKWKEKSYATR